MATDGYDWLYRKYNGPAEDFSKHPPMGFFEKIVKVMGNPTEFFDRTRFEKSIGPSFKYLAALSLVLTFFASSILFIAFFLKALPDAESWIYWSPAAIYGGVLAAFMVGTGLTHLMVKLIGGKGGFAETFKPVVYGSTPAILFGWIPMVQVLFFVYSFYLVSKGLSRMHLITGFSAIATQGAVFTIVFALAIGTYGTYVQGPLDLPVLGSMMSSQLGFGPAPEVQGGTPDVFLVIDRSSCGDGRAMMTVSNFGWDASGPIQVYIDGALSRNCTAILQVGLGSKSTQSCTSSSAELSSTGFHEVNLTSETYSGVHQIYCV
jgi:hypothetical protein